MVSISTVSNTTQTGVASTSTQATSTTVAKTTTTATATPTISTTNSSTVKVSAAALTVAKAAVATPPTVAKAISDYQAAKTAGTLDAFVPVSIKDAAAAFTDSADNRAVIREMVAAGKITGIAFTDTKPPTFTFDRSVLSGDLTSTANQSPAQILQKITTKYTLAITNVTAADALTIKPPVANATLALSVADTSDSVTGNITALQTLAKAKTLTNVTFTAATPKPSLTITAAQLKASPELLATIKGDYDFIITGVAAAEAVTVAGNADKVLKSSGSGSTQAKVAITDTSANLVKNIAALELAATAGRLTSITVSDGKALVLTEAQIKADSHFLATTFTSNATVEATAVAAADVLIVQSLVNANSKLTLTKESIADTAANIQANLDSLETAVKAPVASSASNAFTIANIGITDKGSITVTNSTLVKDIDALKVLTGKYTLNVTDISVSDALALKAPSKDATLAISVKDTAANVAANWDKLQAAAKAKTLTSIIVTDSASSLLSMTAPQLKADADALKLVTGDYKLSVIGVAAADVTKTLTTKNIYSVEVKDTAANILKNLTSIQTAVTAAKIQNVVITDAANPSLSISDIFALTTTLPNVTLAAGVKFNVKDTASTVIAHARDDIGDVLKNAGIVTLTDKTTPNLTLADAITLKGIANLAAGTKYNVTDGGSVIATQAAITGEKILSGAASVSINKNFNITDAKAVTGIKTLAKGTVYSITDTADNILAQSAVSGDKILSGANTVTVVDTSANIVAKLDQLEILAKAGKIADIKFTDTPTGALNITNEQLVKDAEAIGKIISQRALPTLAITKPNTPVLFSDSIYFCNFNAGYNDGTIILNGNAQIKNNEGKDGTDAIYFDGNNSSIILNNKNLNLDNKNFSLSFDCKPDPIQSPYSVIFSKMDYVRAGGYDPNSPKILVMGNNGKGWIDAYDNVQKDLKHIEFNNFNDNHWHNINILRSNNIISVKCDNILVGQFDVDPNYRFNLTGIQFGSHQDSNGPQGTFFKGYIDNILVTNVDATMPTSVPPPTVNTNNIPSITNNNKPTFTGTAVGNSTITLYNNGSNLPWATVQSDAGGYWSYTPSNPISDGNYSITAKASNATGIQSAASPAFIFRVDTVPPSAPTIIGPTGTISNNKPVISGTAEPNSVINLYNGNIQIATTTTNLNGIWTYTPTSNLSDGSYSVTAKANDTAGNISLASNIVSFKINTELALNISGRMPSSCKLSNGNTVVVYTKNNAKPYGVIVDKNGSVVKNEFALLQLPAQGTLANLNSTYNLQVSPLNDGGFVVSGYGATSGDAIGVSNTDFRGNFYQKFTSDGAQTGNLVITHSSGVQNWSYGDNSFAYLNDGSSISTGHFGNGAWSIKASILSKTGSIFNENIAVSQSGIAVSPRVVISSDQTKSLFVWTKYSGDNSGSAVYARIMDNATQSFVTDEFRINDYQNGNQGGVNGGYEKMFYALQPTFDGGFMIMYNSESGDAAGSAILGRKITLAGNTVNLSPEQVINGMQNSNEGNPSITKINDNEFFINYASYNGPSTTLYGKIVDSNFNVIKNDFSVYEGQGNPVFASSSLFDARKVIINFDTYIGAIDSSIDANIKSFVISL